ILRAAVPRIETRVNIEQLWICQASDLLRPRRFTAWQSMKLREIDLLRTFGLQVGVEEFCVAYLVVGIIADVLRHVAIEIRKRRNIGWISTGDSAELIVLLP